MTLKESTLIRRGIHSELFLLAYTKPDTGYRLAQRQQDSTKRPDTSKTGKALDKLVQAEYLYLKNKQFHPNFEKLSVELSEYLDSKGIELDETESKFIQELIEHSSSFPPLLLDISYRIISQPPRIHHIDALQVISNHIGMVCTFFQMSKNSERKITTGKTQRKSIKIISKELDEDISKINDTMQGKVQGSKLIKKGKMKNVNTLGDFMKSFILSSKILDKTSKSTLKKLEKLWDQHDGFQTGITTSENLRKMFTDSK